jgi:hypothetical protein
LTPAVLIRLPLEGAPRVYFDTLSEAEEWRLVDWIGSQDGLAELVARAFELAEEARAA